LPGPPEPADRERRPEQPPAHDRPEVGRQRRAGADEKSAACVVQLTLGWLAFVRRRRHSATSSQLEVKGSRAMDINEVARASGMLASTPRYYEEKGWIT